MWRGFEPWTGTSKKVAEYGTKIAQREPQRCSHRSGGAKRQKSVSAVTHSHPLSMASAACTASATNLPLTLAPSQSWRKMRQWPSPGRTKLHVGRAKSASRKRNACPVVEGGWNMRGFVTTLTKPCRTSSESANGAGRISADGAGGQPRHRPQPARRSDRDSGLDPPAFL